MYKALESPSLEEIVILEKRWRSRIDDLRSWGAQSKLVCPGCRQDVHVKAGKSRRWHFAHKHLRNCPLSRQSPELLNARAVLYEWIVEEFRYRQVKIEIEKELPGLPRPVDIWIGTDTKPIVYWIFDTRLTPEMRNSLIQGMEHAEVLVNWLFTASFLHEDELYPGRLHLTTTEREFLCISTLDELAQLAGDASGKSITYLYPEKASLVTFRRLRLQHAPQRFAGRRLENQLKEVTILPKSGEFIHPDEIDWLERYRRKADAAQIRLSRQQKMIDQARFLVNNNENGSVLDSRSSNPSDQIKLQPDESKREEPVPAGINALLSSRQPFRREAVCRYCGSLTTDWVSFFGKTGECLCRECYTSGKI